MNVLFHLTPAKNLPAIKAEGLEPRLGRRSVYFGARDKAVHLYDGAALESAIHTWVDFAFDEGVKVAVVGVALPDVVPLHYRAEGERSVKERIAPEHVRVLCPDIAALTYESFLAMTADFEQEAIAMDEDHAPVRAMG